VFASSPSLSGLRRKRGREGEAGWGSRGKRCRCGCRTWAREVRKHTLVVTRQPTCSRWCDNGDDNGAVIVAGFLTALMIRGWWWWCVGLLVSLCCPLPSLHSTPLFSLFLSPTHFPFTCITSSLPTFLLQNPHCDAKRSVDRCSSLYEVTVEVGRCERGGDVAAAMPSLWCYLVWVHPQARGGG
jgi:hypothetical protein